MPHSQLSTYITELGEGGDGVGFGQRLLQSMGWKEGKGLGKSEDGIVDFIKARFKNNNKGLGFKGNEHELDWVKHQEDFEEILKQLNPESSCTEVAPSSMQSRSKAQRGRHQFYSKLIRGKDLSNRSEKDLAAIVLSLGRKPLPEEPQEPCESSAAEADSNTFVSTLSCSDYFASKWQAKKAAYAQEPSEQMKGCKDNVNSTSTEALNDVSEEPYQELVNKEHCEANEEVTDGKKKKKERRKERKEEIIDKETCTAGLNVEEETAIVSSSTGVKRKKSKRKRKDEQEEEYAADKKISDAESTQEVDAKPRKKRRHREVEDGDANHEAAPVGESITVESIQQTKRKKRRHKEVDSIEESTCRERNSERHNSEKVVGTDAEDGASRLSNSISNGCKTTALNNHLLPHYRGVKRKSKFDAESVYSEMEKNNAFESNEKYEELAARLNLPPGLKNGPNPIKVPDRFKSFLKSFPQSPLSSTNLLEVEGYGCHGVPSDYSIGRSNNSY